MGQRVLRLRRLVGLSQNQLSRATGKPGVSKDIISKVERGERQRLTVDEVLDLAAALRVHPLAVMVGTEGTVSIAGEDYTVADVWAWFASRGARPLSPTWETEPTERQVEIGMPFWVSTTPGFAELARETMDRIMVEQEREDDK